METDIKLSQQAIAEFKTIYQEEYGIVLSDDEAAEIAIRLLRFFDILIHPVDTAELFHQIPSTLTRPFPVR